MFFRHNLKTTSTKSRSSDRKIIRRPKTFVAVVSLSLSLGGPVLAIVQATDGGIHIQHVVNHPCTIEMGHENAPAATEIIKTIEQNAGVQVGTANDPIRMVVPDECSNLVRQIRHSASEPFEPGPEASTAYWECSSHSRTSKLLEVDFSSGNSRILKQSGSTVETMFSMGHEGLSWTWTNDHHERGEFRLVPIKPLVYSHMRGTLFDIGQKMLDPSDPTPGQSYSCRSVLQPLTKTTLARYPALLDEIFEKMFQ